MDIKPMTISDAKAALRERDNAELKKAVAEFESLFINQMLKTMRESVLKGDMFHGGNGEEVYSSMLDEELSRVMASAGGIGLHKVLLEQFSKGVTQEAMEPVRDRAEASGGPAPATDTAAEAQAPLKAPVKGKLSSYFGLRHDPFTGEMKFHHGVDIAARKGSPVFPAAPGKVVFSGERKGYGNVVEVLHDNGMVTRYGHNQENLVKQGDTVKPSEPIAYVGSTGRSTGPHLHFEVLKDGSPVDPVRFRYG